ncbi:MAG: glycosyltransferase family A protein [Spirochaetales bacterium]|nr:glycosyltransferase family A protein [Spirochaetales bacterium]
MPEVSIIIPVYNREQLLKEAVYSVFGQTFKDYEIIIVNDGSTDNSLFEAEQLCKEPNAEGRCRVINIEHCGFPGAVRNRGVESSSGEFIAFLDSDDLWLPSKIEQQLEYMKTSKALISHTREIWQRGDRIISQKKQRHERAGDIFKDALGKCIIGPSTVMIDREFYIKTGGFHEKIEIAEDYEYWLRITASNRIGYLDIPLTTKRAGGWPQLSEKYGKIEWFRLNALSALLGVELPMMTVAPLYMGNYKWPGFDDQHFSLAMDELLFKCNVWADGCRKRGKNYEADEFSGIISSIQGDNYNETGAT